MVNKDIHQKLDAILARFDALERRQELYFEQIEALMNLHSMLAPLYAPLPPMRKWAIAPDFGILLYSLLQEYQADNILELGGGVSTVITGYYLAQHGGGAVNAFDHHELYASLARRELATHHLSDFATVTHAPLSPLEIHGESWNWYDVTEFDLVQEVDFLTIDGPPQEGNSQGMARYPAVPVLFNRLKPGAIILVDDTHREDERRCVERWIEEFGLMKLREVDNEKGAMVLRKV